ncbi:MAG: hypothetical protein RJA83_507 [Pseudomonadota bacterium]|jgi:hypothetical protein
MANVILDQFAHLKQPACDYLSQGYEISHELNDLIETLKQLLSLVEECTKASHNLLDRGGIPLTEFLSLSLCQSQGIKYLRQGAEDIEAFEGFKALLQCLGAKEVAHV